MIDIKLIRENKDLVKFAKFRLLISILVTSLKVFRV